MTFVEIDRSAWEGDGRSRPFALRHGFDHDPRLSHEAVATLAGRLPETSIEMNRSDLELLHAVDGAEPLDRPAEIVAREIVAHPRWMAIKNLEQVPDYRAVVNEGLDSADLGLGLGPAMNAREGYIFLSAASTVTPAHVDHEHNLLLQVVGTKRVTVGSFADPDHESDVMEGMHSGRYGRTGVLPHEPRTFELEPGTGVYIPPRAVHMVEVGEGLSISLSLVFHTRELERSARVYAVNAKLRKTGLRPRPPGSSVAADKAKSAAAIAWRTLRSRG